jgi:hypothetical protein
MARYAVLTLAVRDKLIGCGISRISLIHARRRNLVPKILWVLLPLVMYALYVAISA